METKSNTKVSALMLLEQLKKERAKLIVSKTILDKKDNHVYPIANAPFEIPIHWVWCYLSDISLIQEGPGIRKHQYATSGIQFLTVTNILEGSVDLEKSKKYISKEQYKNYSHFTINKGDIVTACSGGSWGKSAIYELDNKLILNTSTLRLRFYNDLGDNYYLYYLTKTNYFKDSLSSYVTGQQPNYGYSHYSKIPIPLPPLPEQQRIVATLDEAFEAIAKAKANAEQNLKNAKELFESYLQGVFENKGEGWEEKMLKEIGIAQTGTTPKTADKENYGDFIPFIKPADIDIKGNGEIRYDNDGLSEQGLKNGRKMLKGSILMVCIGATIGKVGFVDRDVSCNQQINSLTVNNDFSSKFIYYALSSKGFFEQVMLNSAQATLPIINKGKWETLIVSFPKYKTEQEDFANKFDLLQIETKKLEAIYQQKINDLEELKKSVLQKAFSGELK
jgi:type I restriction enzyme S subunit